MSFVDSYKEHVNRPYGDYLQRLGMDFEAVRATGALVEDRHGRKYIDCIGGQGNVNVGHNHPHIAEAMIRALQAGRPFGWPFISEDHVRLAEKLAELAPAGLERCLIVNSGTEATESALKLARLATGRSGVIACQGGWHGFTLGALSVSEPRACKSFGPLLEGVRRVPYGDARAASEAISKEIGAMIVEPIQGENGGVMPPAGYLKELADICTASGVMLIFDEIKTGMGKTGTMFACEFDQAAPDVLLVGKSLGGGMMPIGAMVAKRQWWTKFGLSFPMSSSTYGGNALSCAAGLAAIEVIESENLCANAARQGRRLQEALAGLLSLHPDIVQAVTGRGLLLSLRMASSKLASEITMRCVKQGVLIVPTSLNHACMLIEPPLCISDAQMDEVICALRQACDEIGAVKT